MDGSSVLFVAENRSQYDRGIGISPNSATPILKGHHSMLAMSRSQVSRSLCVVAIACMAGCPASESDEQANAPAVSSSVREPVATDTRPNAAKEYARLDALAGKDLLEPFDQLDSDDRVTPERSQYLMGKQDLIVQIMNASAIERCEFVIDPNAGLNLIIPELAGMRRFARILKYDAERCLMSANGSQDATDRLAAMLRVSSHAGQQPLLIGKLVGIACMDLATKAIIDHAKKLKAADQRLVSELQKAKSSALLDFSGAFDRELAEAVKMIRRGEISPMRAADAGTIPEARREIVVKEVERAFAELKKVWGKPGAEQLMKRLIDTSTVDEAEAFISWMSMPPKLVAKTQQGIDGAIAALGGT